MTARRPSDSEGGLAMVLSFTAERLIVIYGGGYRMYYVVIPRTRWVDRPEYGVWDVVKDEEGDLMTFDTYEDAIEYDKSIGRMGFVLKLVG